MKLQQLRHFLFVVEEGGFRAAADRANRSQAALSASIKELEKTLGQRLFEVGNKAILTPFGETCLPKVEQFLSVYQALEDDLKASASGEKGKIRIASVPSLVTKLLPSVLVEYSKKYPDIEIVLIDDNSVGVANRLLAGEIDLALGNCTSIDKANIDFTLLISDPIGVVCLKANELNNELNQSQGLTWQQLMAQPFIYNGTCRLLENTPAEALNRRARYTVENITSLFSLLRNDLGITTLPKLAFPANEPELVWIDLVDPSLNRQIGIFKLADKSISPPAQAFYNLCIAYVQKNYWL
ncbi:MULTISPECIES: LysR family transcriptional regulator [unclassified Psychrobacter]|uniref:LysR family transcriptional regulator n=1 Tax=unclassified Psychrobacter TaxID=196806 RepID=UPI0025B45071|nr:MULTISPECIES: LysR family transcriptional regulator [unclassified Psychrobacter]MDN3453786.1 LysR family transcriptional regulator [Psychrobacter sp. APC 3350]MDN3503054.1 LysR family transcriptional regulator [Psychrobacter sp. 5A.1]